MIENYFEINQKLKYLNFEKKSLLLLAIICITALSIRFYYVPYGIPVTFDAFSGYFLYALDISILGHLPNYTMAQSGWSEFLSLFFMFFHSDNFIDYLNLQRTVSVVVSGITVIPIYFICKKFFNNYYSLIGATIFALEPRIIINSTLGLSEPLYILVISLGILLFLNLNRKIIYLSFGFFAWATIIRPEGQFWFVAFSVMYFLRFRKKRKDLLMYLVCIAVFLLVLSPIVIHRIECCDNDAIIGRILAELWQYQNNTVVLNENANSVPYGPNFINGVKLFGWAMIPIFIIFVPLGLIPIFKHFKFPNYLLILVPSILAFPIMYSVSIAPDTRYAFPIFLIFCVISLFGIRWISDNFDHKKLILGIIMFGVIIGSLVFLDDQKIKYQNDKEAYEISKIIIKDVKGVNKGADQVIKFFKIAEIEDRWQNTKSPGKLMDSFKINRFSIKEINSLEKFVEFEKRNGLTHLIIDKSQSMPDIFVDVFDNEEKYKYLIKEFDSQEYGYTYHVKKFKINYNIFEIRN